MKQARDLAFLGDVTIRFERSSKVFSSKDPSYYFALRIEDRKIFQENLELKFGFDDSFDDRFLDAATANDVAWFKPSSTARVFVRKFLSHECEFKIWLNNDDDFAYMEQITW